MLIEGFQITEPAVLVNEGVLIELLSLCFTDKAGCRNKFDIDLTSLPWILHLLVRFYLLFGIGKLDGLAIDPAQDTVQAGDGSGIATHSQLDPEHHQTDMRIPAPHILNELDLGIGVLIGVAVRTVRAVCQRLECTVILLAPAVDILSGSLVADRSRCNTFFEGILNYHLLKPHVLCYLTHSE